MSRQSYRRNVNRPRLHRSYTMRELADTLGVHVRTVQGWHSEGMPAIDEQDRPLLFLGGTVRTFLKKRLNKRRTTLGSDEIYCLRCASGVTPTAQTVSVEVTDRRLGRCSRQLIIRATCPKCGGTVVRFASLQSINETVWWTKLHRAEEGLVDILVPCRNTDSKQG